VKKLKNNEKFLNPKDQEIARLDGNPIDIAWLIYKRRKVESIKSAKQTKTQPGFFLTQDQFYEKVGPKPRKSNEVSSSKARAKPKVDLDGIQVSDEEIEIEVSDDEPINAKDMYKTVVTSPEEKEAIFKREVNIGNEILRKIKNKKSLGDPDEDEYVEMYMQQKFAEPLDCAYDIYSTRKTKAIHNGVNSKNFISLDEFYKNVK
jgi:hypothetical protein